MSTRKELLEELNYEIGRLSETLDSRAADLSESNDGLASRIKGALDGHSDALERHADALRDASNRISNSLNELGKKLIAAAVIGGSMWIIGKVVEELLERVRYINQKTDLINSIQSLQQRYPSLTYEFIVQRAHVQGADSEVRQAILNELIEDDIVTSVNGPSGEIFKIEPNNPNLLDYWDWLGSVRDDARGTQKQLGKT